MIRYENDCCDCATEHYRCNPYCSRKRVPHLYCDHCKNEWDELFWHDGKQLCLSCLDSELEEELDSVELESVELEEE